MQTKRRYPNDFKNMNGNTNHLSSILIRRYISASVLTAMILLMLSCNNNTERHQAQTAKVADTSGIARYISRTIEKYPLITLADIYKGAFQDYMGPAHIIPDSQSARTYIVKELETADTLVGDYYEPCSWMGNYYRVNLSVNPHYRIIEKNIFEKEILPLLK